MNSQPTPSDSRTQAAVRRLRVGIWVVQAVWLAGAISLGMGTARAEDLSAPVSTVQQQAVAGQAADVGTTGVGLLLGAAEANPLGLLSLGVKVWAHQKIQQAPPQEQPRLWGAYGAMGWGAAANNMCVIAAIATGGAGAVLCPMIGLATGLSVWDRGSSERDRATFAAMCDQARAKKPEIVCTYRES